MFWPLLQLTFFEPSNDDLLLGALFPSLCPQRTVLHHATNHQQSASPDHGSDNAIPRAGDSSSTDWNKAFPSAVPGLGSCHTTKLLLHLNCSTGVSGLSSKTQGRVQGIMQGRRPTQFRVFSSAGKRGRESKRNAGWMCISSY